MIERRPRYAPRAVTPPRHVAIVMDGTRAWARDRSACDVGDAAGSALARIAYAAADAGIELLTVAATPDAPNGYATAFAAHERRRLVDANVRVRTLGRATHLAPDARDALAATCEATAGGRGLTLNVALSCDARADLCAAIRALAIDVRDGKRALADIDDDALAAYLPTAGLPDPDLLIRTGGELRVASALLFEIAYSELWATTTAWPDFDATHLHEAIEAFSGRQRRFGT